MTTRKIGGFMNYLKPQEKGWKKSITGTFQTTKGTSKFKKNWITDEQSYMYLLRG